LRALGYKGFSSFAQGSSAPEHSYLKLATSELQKSVFEFGMELLGPLGAVTDAERGEQSGRFAHSFFMSFANTIAGGSSELQRNDDVRVVGRTGAGDQAFCTGIDRTETMGDGSADAKGERVVGSGSTPFMFDDPGENIGPKSCDLWKPVIAAVNGIACGGAFYMLGEVEFIIAAEHATFFDPHVTYAITAASE